MALIIGGVLSRFLAILVGFVVTAGLLSALPAVLPRLIPDWVQLDGSPRRPLIATNLCWSLVAAMVGGYVTAWIAPDNPLNTALALGIVILVLGALGTMQSRQRYPLGYMILLLFITPIGVVAGALVRMKVLGQL